MFKKDTAAFTIVELVVVIVIIITLTLITVIAFNGVQARSKASTAISLGNMAARKAEAWYSNLGTYPTYTQLSTGKINSGDATQTGPVEARVDDAANKLFDAAVSNPADEKKVGYRSCTLGAQVEYYDAVAKAVAYIGIGGASSTTACS